MNYMATTYVGQIELKARKEGIEEGIKEGKVEGIKEAKVEAEKEAYEKEVKLVLSMIKENLSNEIISRCSEFTIEEIEKIREKA